MSLIFVDCEAWGGCPATGQLTEFGAVELETRETFYGMIVASYPDPTNPAIPIPTGKPTFTHEYDIAFFFETWLKKFGNPKFVSDNLAYDWMWINDLFHRTLGKNPFGYSGRRIGDFYAGLRGDFYAKQDWKKLRVTSHDHNPVHDALGNAQAFDRLLRGER